MKYIFIALSLGLSLICFLKVGFDIGISFAIGEPILIAAIALGFYLLYKKISNYVSTNNEQVI